ncbi:Glycyl-tRNA synthetase [Carpediemonas membranifera]|uniref:glycine--tRNA ligase n=1 Tax=Carpediemonas membranifera TaxID=201153 RepID=A0A8J6ATG5_9EUKA|nr:Glycyl-tRNA synthetase [Carpediemonas membranifera]|eukprot:KAG9394156.1 Glycyl-tRNA synthetase [Carpediemonas membranifera]
MASSCFAGALDLFTNEYPLRLEVEEGDKKPVVTLKSSDVSRQFGMVLKDSGRFVFPGFEIYGGCAGLYDLGYVGTMLETNILSLWRDHFVKHEGMFEIKSTSITPRPVFVASGHATKFHDVMAQDSKTETFYRMDQEIEKYCDRVVEECQAKLDNPKTPLEDEKRQEIEAKVARLGKIRNMVDGMTCAEIQKIMDELQLLSPEGNAFLPAEDHNLMFGVRIGPTAKDVNGYLRPELAQGIFVNFLNIKSAANEKLPFAGATVGLAYRNEIAPRGGLLRVREFTLAEIEHFFDPLDNTHPGFDEIKDVELSMWSSPLQMTMAEPVTITAAQALEGVEVTNGDGTKSTLKIDNATHVYFIARVQLFLESLGIGSEFIRFRQHLPHQMAHYATDCWDGEIYMASGWVECIGLANRSANDLKWHADATKTKLEMFRPYAEPKTVHYTRALPIKAVIGKMYRREAGIEKKLNPKEVIGFFEGVSTDEAQALRASISDGKLTVTINGVEETVAAKADFKDVTKKDKETVVAFQDVTELVHGEYFTPNVIEPSFGVGRILSAVMEHAYKIRVPHGTSILAGPTDPVDKKAKKVKLDDHFDMKRSFFSFPPEIAPYKVCIVDLLALPKIDTTATPEEQAALNTRRDGMNAVPRRVARGLKGAGIAHVLDNTSISIGRRYARNDAIGIPFAVTVDGDTVDSDSSMFATVTVRERDSGEQIRVPLAEDAAAAITTLLETGKGAMPSSALTGLLVDLTEGRRSWAEVREQYGLWSAGQQE